METQIVFFAWIWNIWGSLYRKYIKPAKNGGFCEELFGENDFEAVLVNFCCYDCGTNASEAVQKIGTRTLLELCQLK